MKKTIYLSAAFLIIVGLVLPKIGWAIGQLTQPIVLENVLRGQIVQETLILYGAETKEATFGLLAEGDIKDWTNFYLPEDLASPIQEIKIPAQSQVKVIAQFRVPEDTPNGTYSGVVALTSLPDKEATEGVSVTVGLRVDREVSITVTEQEIIDFQTTVIPLKYGVKSGEPLKIKVIYDNQGNVAIKPNIQLKISKIESGKVIHNAIYPYPEQEEAVKPFQRKEFPNLIEWPTAGQEKGKYKAEIKVLFKDKVYQEESFRFQVGVEITEKLLGAITTLGRGNLVIGWFIIGGFFLVLVGILIFFQKSKKLKNQNINKGNEGQDNINN